MRLIDADQFEAFGYTVPEGADFDDGVLMVLKAIDEAPTIKIPVYCLDCGIFMNYFKPCGLEP